MLMEVEGPVHCGWHHSLCLLPELYTHREKELSTSKCVCMYFLSVLDSDRLFQALTAWMSLQR